MRALLAGALLMLTACSGPAPVPAPSPESKTAKRCRPLIGAVPGEVKGQPQRTTEPSSHLTAAWGDPAITLACGVSKPSGMNPASKCWEVNGVGWYAAKRDGSYRFTTIGRRVFVQVTVPNKYSPQADALVDLAAAVKKHDPLVKKCV